MPPNQANVVRPTLFGTKPVRKREKCSCPNCQAVDAGCEQIVDSKGRKCHNCHYEHCGKSFEYPHRLVQHLNLHTGERPYACEWPGCDYRSTRPDSLKSHKLTHQDKAWECKICNYKFTHKVTYTDHVKKFKARDKKSAKNSEPCTCRHESCGKSFNSPSHLSLHLRTHKEGRKFSCNWPGCDRMFFRSHDLKRHSQTHNGDKNHMCESCDYMSFRISDLRRHVLRVHEKKKTEKKAVTRRTRKKQKTRQQIRRG